METKICTACGQARPLTQFHRFGKGLARVGKWCEDCYQKKKGSPAKQSEQGNALRLSYRVDPRRLPASDLVYA